MLLLLLLLLLFCCTGCCCSWPLVSDWVSALMIVDILVTDSRERRSEHSSSFLKALTTLASSSLFDTSRTACTDPPPSSQLPAPTQLDYSFRALRSTAMNTFIVRIQFVWTGTAANRRREGEEMLHGEQRRGGSAARTGRVVVLGRVVTRVALAMSHVLERHIAE